MDGSGSSLLGPIELTIRCSSLWYLNENEILMTRTSGLCSFHNRIEVYVPDQSWPRDVDHHIHGREPRSIIFIESLILNFVQFQLSDRIIKANDLSRKLNWNYKFLRNNSQFTGKYWLDSEFGVIKSSVLSVFSV